MTPTRSRHAKTSNPFAVLGDNDSSDEDAGPGGSPGGSPGPTPAPKAVRRRLLRPQHPAPRATPGGGAFIFVGIIIASVIGGEVAGIVLRSPPRGYPIPPMPCAPPVPPISPADLPPLITQHPRAFTQFSPERRYVITKGSCPPVRRGLQPQQALQSAFFGRCFHCRCLGHSQKWCPVKKCKRCGAFGHADVVCAGGGGSRR